MSDALEKAWARIRRHPAFRVAAVYAGAGFAVLQVLDLLGVSTEGIRWIGALLTLGFVLAVGGAALAHRTGGARSFLARLPGGRRLAVAVLGLFLLGGAAWLAGSRLVGAPVTPGAERIAVLPFTASGSDEGLGQGMVDLLSTALDQVGGVSTVHPRTVMNRWEVRAREGTVDLEGALAVGREVGAGSVLLGSLVSTGDRVRLSGQLYAVDGSRIGEARTEGDAGEVLDLVDDLAVRMLREVWRSREPIPNLRLAAITTPSLEALQSYLRGERHYRAARWDSAVAAFSDAVAVDSTFALAYLRLAESHGWTSGLGDPQALDNARTAASLADRLPDRERALVRAHLLHEEGDLAALDSLAAYVRVHPDDPMGWYLLADARYHAVQVIHPTEDQLTAPVDSVLAVDPGLSVPIIHLLELQLMTGDSAGYERWLDRYRLAGAADVEDWERIRGIRWSPPDSFPDRFERAFTSFQVDQPVFSTWPRWITVPLVEPGYDAEIAVQLLDDLDPGRRPGTPPNTVLQVRLNTLLATGRVREAVRLAGTFEGEDWTTTGIPLFTAMVAGLVEPAVALEHVPEGMPRQWFEAYGALATGRVDQFRPLSPPPMVDSAPAAAPSPPTADPAPAPAPAPPRFVQAGARAFNAWARLLRGEDTERAAADMDRSLREMGYEPQAVGAASGMAFSLAVHLAGTEAGREEGIRRLETFRLHHSDGLLGPITITVARAYEAAGDTERAAHYYAELLRLWEDADPELQSQVEDARRALRRLTEER